MDNIESLKEQARAELARIRAEVSGGRLNLKPEVESAIIFDSAKEIDKTPDARLNALLKERGMNHDDRRRFIAKMRQAKKGKVADIPAHTRRANEVALKRARERAEKKAPEQ
jgi:hypothetical protein